MSPEKNFDPSNPEYKEVKDLPQKEQAEFVDAEGGFVKREAAETKNRAEGEVGGRWVDPSLEDLFTHEGEFFKNSTITLWGGDPGALFNGREDKTALDRLNRDALFAERLKNDQNLQEQVGRKIEKLLSMGSFGVVRRVYELAGDSVPIFNDKEALKEDIIKGVVSLKKEFWNDIERLLERHPTFSLTDEGGSSPHPSESFDLNDALHKRFIDHVSPFIGEEESLALLKNEEVLNVLRSYLGYKVADEKERTFLRDIMQKIGYSEETIEQALLVSAKNQFKEKLQYKRILEDEEIKKIFDFMKSIGVTKKEMGEMILEEVLKDDN